MATAQQTTEGPKATYQNGNPFLVFVNSMNSKLTCWGYTGSGEGNKLAF